MAEESDVEKTEPASGRRIERAREEGNVPRSKELSSFLVTVVAISALWISSGWMYQHLAGVMHRGLGFSHAQAFEPWRMGEAVQDLFFDGLFTLMPVLLSVMISAAASHLIIGGPILSSRVFQFNLERLNPIPGMKRFVSVNGLVELVKGVIKASFILGIAVYLLWKYRFDLLMLTSMSLEAGVASFMHLIVVTSLALTISLALVAAIDVPYQLWHYFKELRMSRSDLREESKESEGDPQVKGKIRKRQQEMARRRMMEAVPKADVVVTNPTHYAVALKYDSGTMGAPRVVAKGADIMAQTIRELAQKNAVPLLEAPPLARALYFHAKLDEQIPAVLYTAVAEVMAYIYQLNHFIAEGGLPPTAPNAIDVPAGYDPAAA